jgi:hypothetical protein
VSYFQYSLLLQWSIDHCNSNAINRALIEIFRTQLTLRE